MANNPGVHSNIIFVIKFAHLLFTIGVIEL
jgi:hypothetical protein